MKILILQDYIPPVSFGGDGIIALGLAKSFKNAGHDVAIITTVQKKKGEGVSEENGLKIHKLYSSYHLRWRSYISIYNPKVLGEVERIINEYKPDVVHVHNIHYHLSYYSLKLAKKSGAKVFLTAHDTMLFHYGKLDKPEKISPWAQFRKYKRRYNPLRNTLIRHYLKYVDKIFPVSRALEEALNQNGITNTEVIHNGIDVSEWQMDEASVETFKAKYGLHNKRVMLFGGRLSAAKGGHEAVKALAKVIKKIPNAVLLVLGSENEYSKEMIGLASNLGISKTIIFTGWISGQELKSAYHASDVVLVLSTYLDPFPTVNLEAMASLKPVVGTFFGGTPEVVMDEKTGYIVDPRDTENVADKIIKLLSERNTFGTTGYQRIKKDFSLGKTSKSYLDRFGGM